MILFVVAGSWQLSRMNEVRAANDLIESRMQVPEQSLAQVLAEVGDDLDALAFRRVSATGAYDTNEEVLLSSRSHEGRPGHHLLTPLAIGEGAAIIVDRGWVPLELDEPPVAQARPVAAGDVQVTVNGILFPPDEDSQFGPRTGEGQVDYVGRVDLEKLQQQMSTDLAPVYLLAQEQQPAPPGSLPLQAASPDLDDGPHLSYAVQWFLFALVVVVGYPLLVRRTARDRAAARSGPEESDAAGVSTP
ncbi:MAG: hypothetical protein GEU81_14845 [Nitriliruptorales bacterium]|nr:hypothetical protein [Nitriliruptorales bacterium]